MPTINGFCDDRFAAVGNALQGLLDRGEDVGASVAVAHHGDLVADLWGGFCDEARRVSWKRNTIVNVMSTTKTMVNLCALLLVDRGELDLGAPVARYWPEFAAAGKGDVLVRHLLGHTAGLPSWEHEVRPVDLADWERCTETLAAQAPQWEPGTRSGYHALTQGYLIGEVIRRITGETVGAFFRTELAGPLGADFWIGLPAEHDARVSPLIAPPGESETAPPGAPRVAARALFNPPVTAATTATDFWRRSEVPAANGHGNARAIATVQALVSGRGQARGRRLLSGRTVARIFEEQANGVDLVLLTPVRWGIGYGLSSESMPIGPEACQWGGHGGSVVLSDLATGLTIAYAMNRMQTDDDWRGTQVINAARLSLEPRWRRAARVAYHTGRRIERRLRA